jgi:N-acetylneuraminate lyase
VIALGVVGPLGEGKELDAMSGPLTGLIPACHTPFHADGSLNLDAVSKQADLLRESDARSVFIGGTTGEWSSLTLDERIKLTQRWVEVAGNTMQVAVHVGDNCLADAVTLAKHSRDAGAAGIAATTPSYFKPSGIDDLIDFCVPIAAAAAPLPFYFYDIPGMTGSRLPMGEYFKKARHRIPTLQGLKFSNNDLVELQECIQLDDGAFDILFGSDEVLLAALALGVKGAVGNTYNYAMPLYNRVIKAFDANDLVTARREQVKAVALVKILADVGFQAASKCVWSFLGVDCGPVRPPVRNLTAEQKLALFEKLSKLDVFPKPLVRPT